MKHIQYLFLFLLLSFQCIGQSPEFIFPNLEGWNTLSENAELSFQVKTTLHDNPIFTLDGSQDLGIQFDTLGNFYWKPAFDLVNRVENTKDFTVIFQAIWPDNKRLTKSITFTVRHVNRPPTVEDLPVFYVKQSSLNTYQISSDLVSDPDGDPLVFKAIPSQMPEGSTLSALGQLTWTLSRSQFINLRNQTLTIEFIVQDQPAKAEVKGKIKIQQTQQDLPPEILIVPGDSIYKIKEDETLNLKLYVSDPNGDDNVRSVGFISNDSRVPMIALKENTPLQHEFTWSPNYNFVDDLKKTIVIDVIFFALDKSNNKSQKRIKIQITDAENIVEKDGNQYQKYRNNLIGAMLLINQLDDNQKKLNSDYKQAKKGKKKRSILNASLGAATGVSPVALDADQAKIVSGVGGTTVLTLGTLEATEVIGKSKEDILEKIRIGIDIRNRVQAAGDDFARKYALRSSRRGIEFEKDIEKLRASMSDQKLVLLELDAYSKTVNYSRITNKDIKKVFLDFSDE